MYLDRAFRKMTPFSDSFPKRAEFLFCILLMLSFQFFLFQLYRTMIFLLLLLPSLRRASALQVPNFLGRNYFPLVSSIQRDAAYEEGPWFCHGLDCPDYTTLSVPAAIASKVELRSYDKTLWVSTVVDDVTTFDDGLKEGFQRLFQYISGDNVERQKVEMTAPVLSELHPAADPQHAGSLKVSFFVPRQLHGHPPTPTDPRVAVDPRGPADFYVLSFGGWADQKTMDQRTSDLRSLLVSAGIADYEPTPVRLAGYDAPFRFLNRHNEIWLARSAAMPEEST